MKKKFRVLSYNIHKGFTARNRRFVLAEMREAVRDVDPDFVFLQEVMGEHRRGPTQPQFEYLADALWPHFAYGRNAEHSDGHHGNAILSKVPILSWENEDVSTSKLERRGILHATVRPFEDRPELHLLCAHFGLLERDRQMQARRLCARLQRKIRFGDGVVVAGDFNDWALKLSRFLKHRVGLDEAFHVRNSQHARTFPARLPMLRLDRIYFHGLEPRLARCLHRAPWARLSDHAPLVADFEWA